MEVAASDFYSLPDDQNEMQEQAVIYLILTELQRYVPFNLGDHWGDPSSDVDWENSFLNLNTGHPLCINEVGSEPWCPEVSYPEISNLYFAGDFCKNRIMITTVEAAVLSGLEAAKALCLKERIGSPIEIVEPDSYPQSLMAVWKIALAPLAFGAKCWSLSYDGLDKVIRGAGSDRAPGLLGSAVSLLAENAVTASVVAVECWNAVRAIYGQSRMAAGLVEVLFEFQPVLVFLDMVARRASNVG